MSVRLVRLTCSPLSYLPSLTPPISVTPLHPLTAAPRTHWQQARLILPEPLAVNKGERVTGTIRFKVNDSRSYDLTLDIAVDRGSTAAEPSPNPLRRNATYNLSQQTFK